MNESPDRVKGNNNIIDTGNWNYNKANLHTRNELADSLAALINGAAYVPHRGKYLAWLGVLTAQVWIVTG